MRIALGAMAGLASLLSADPVPGHVGPMSPGTLRRFHVGRLVRRGDHVIVRVVAAPRPLLMAR
jgi:hypothetical protein